MLSDREQELIHGDVDGALDASERAALAQLLAERPDAAALHADLLRLRGVFAQVPASVPSDGLRAALLAAIPLQSRPIVAPPLVVPPLQPTPRTVPLLTLAMRRMEAVFMSRKLFLIGATSVAIIAVIAGRIFPIPSTGNEVGTIGGSSIDSTGMGGVQKADRYRGRTMSEQDISVSDPQIAVLFQNQDILTLVKSGAFREAMNSEAFRELSANEAFRKLNSSEAFHELMNSEAFAKLAQNDVYRRMMANDVARDQLMRAAERKEMAKLDAGREAANVDAFRELSNFDAYREASKMEAFHDVMANDAFRKLMANEAFRELLANEAFRKVAANEAFRELSNSEAFARIARSAQLSELFLNEAARMR